MVAAQAQDGMLSRSRFDALFQVLNRIPWDMNTLGLRWCLVVGSVSCCQSTRNKVVFGVHVLNLLLNPSLISMLSKILELAMVGDLIGEL